VAAWRGGADGAAKGAKALRERVAGIALRLERLLDTWRTYELQELAALLDVVKLSIPNDQSAKKKDASPYAFHRPPAPTPVGVFVGGTSSFSRKMLVKATSIFLAWPLQTNLFVVKATDKMVGEDLAKAAEIEARKKGRGITKRRAEAKELRDAADEAKKFAISDTTFLYCLAPDEAKAAFTLPDNLTVYTQNVARGAPSIQLRIVQQPKASSSAKKTPAAPKPRAPTSKSPKSPKSSSAKPKVLQAILPKPPPSGFSFS